MKKNEIIRGLQKLSPYRIKCLDIVYHKMTTCGSYYYRYNFSAMSQFTDVPLCEILLSLYKLRAYVRAIHLVYFDIQGQMQQIDYMVKNFIDCETLSDFINSK